MTRPLTLSVTRLSTSAAHTPVAPHSRNRGRGRRAGSFWGVALLSVMGLASGCASQGGSQASGAAAAGTAGSAAAPAAAETAAPMRIGTYDSRAVGLASARSAAFAESLRELRRRHADAKKAGDSKLVKELEREGAGRQMRLHMQGFSNAPVTDCLDAVRDQLPGVARAKGLAAIVSSADYRDPAAEVVDITGDIVALFKPDDATLRLIADIRDKPVIPLEDVARSSAKE
jgi:hypothetical protein